MPLPAYLTYSQLKSSDSSKTHQLLDQLILEIHLKHLSFHSRVPHNQRKRLSRHRPTWQFGAERLFSSAKWSWNCCRSAFRSGKKVSITRCPVTIGTLGLSFSKMGRPRRTGHFCIMLKLSVPLAVFTE